MNITTLFSDRQFYKNLFVIALPIMFQNLVNSMVNLADTVMIGRLGTVEIAAVGLGNQIVFLYTLSLFGLCSGASIFTSQFWGKRDIMGIRMNVGFSMLLALAGGVLFTVLTAVIPARIIGIYSRDPSVIALGAQYLRIISITFIPFGISTVFMHSLRSVEKVKPPMITTFIALSTNVILNYFLIFGIGPFPVMGVRGAAIATVISRVVEMLLLVGISYIKKYPPAGSPAELAGFGILFIKRYIRIVLPAMLNEIFWSSGMSMQNLIFARTHTDAIAAFNIVVTVNQLTFILFFGLSNGAAVLIGKRIGEGNEVKAREYAHKIAIFTPLVSIIPLGILLVIPQFIPFVFNVNETVIDHVRLMFIILASIYPFRSFNMCMVVGVFRAGGDTIFCLIYDVMFLWGFALPLAAIAAYFFKVPVWALYICVNTEEYLKLILGIWRLRTGKWLRNVISGI